MTLFRWSPRLISVEALILLTFCILDLTSSAWLFHRHLAIEANPLLRPFVEAGIGSFVLVKALSFLPGIAYTEWLRRHRPEFARGLLRMAAVAYGVIYLAGYVRQL